MVSTVAGWGPNTCMALHVVEVVKMLKQVMQNKGHHGAGLGIAQMQQPTA